MKEFLSKFTSRKLWAAIIGIMAGLAVIFGVDEGVITTIAGAMVSVSSVVAYIITEGRIDAAALSHSATQLRDAVALLSRDETKEDE